MDNSEAWLDAVRDAREELGEEADRQGMAPEDLAEAREAGRA